MRLSKTMGNKNFADKMKHFPSIHNTSNGTVRSPESWNDRVCTTAPDHPLLVSMLPMQQYTRTKIVHTFTPSNKNQKLFPKFNSSRATMGLPRSAQSGQGALSPLQLKVWEPPL